MKKKLTINNPAYVLSAFYILFYFVDALYKYTKIYAGHPLRLGPLVKGFFVLLILIYALRKPNKTKIQILLAIGMLFVGFLIGQLALGIPVNFKENLNVFVKYQFIFFLSIFMFDIIRSPDDASFVWKKYKMIIFINSLLVILGALLKIKLFKTYQGPWRFGYDGLIAAQNEASYFFILALSLLYYRYFYLNEKNILFWLVYIASFLVGTKAVLLYAILLTAFHIVSKVSIKKLLIYVGIGGIVIYVVFYRLINKFIMNAWLNFMYFYHKHGFWFAITSGRNIFFKKKLLPLVSEWGVLNWLFGGHDIVKHYIEMGFIDLFLFFGLLGFLLYLYLFLRITDKIRFTLKFKAFFVLALLGVVFISGHFFESAIAGINFIMFIISSYAVVKTKRLHL